MNRLGALIADCAGGTAIITALVAPVLVGAVALSVEVSGWYAERRTMQRVADGAAITGVMAWAAGSSQAQAQTAATDAARLNGMSSGTTTRFVTWTGAFSNQALEVTITREVPSLLTSLLEDGSQTLTVSATAVRQTRGRDCILGLRTTGTSVSLIGNPSVALNGCSVASNSALGVGGSADLSAQAVYAAGSISGQSAIDAPGGIHPGSAVVDDPYADLPIPSVSGPLIDGRSNTTRTLSPGNYSRLDFGSQAKITLNPGTYVINNGNFNVNGGAQVTGNGVTIILTGSGSVSINGNADINLSAPGTNSGSPYTGVVMFHTGTSASTINGGADATFQGAIYFPRGDLTFSGNSAAGSGGCTQVVAQSVRFQGNANLGSDCSSLGTRPIGGARAQLVR